jgi:hypothetical protein
LANALDEQQAARDHLPARLTKVKAVRANQDDRALTPQGVVPVSYRTILVHLNDSRRARKLLHHAAEIARVFEARLIGLHVSPTFHGRAIDPGYHRAGWRLAHLPGRIRH